MVISLSTRIIYISDTASFGNFLNKGLALREIPDKCVSIVLASFL